MSEIDDRLRNIALEAQRHPQGSPKRQKAVDRLLRILQHSGKLGHPPVPPQLKGLYGEIYAVAQQHLFCYIFNKIDNYNPNKGEVLQWANNLLRLRFPDAIAEVTQLGKTFPRDNSKRMNLDDLDTQTSSDPTVKSRPQELREYLKDDPDRIFCTVHVKHNPHATFQAIALKIIEGWSWQDIATEFGEKIPTLSSFYQRKLKNFKPYFQSYLA